MYFRIALIVVKVFPLIMTRSPMRMMEYGVTFSLHKRTGVTTGS